jgi:hypothetical protein
MNNIRSSLGYGAPRAGLRATPTPACGVSLRRDYAVGAPFGERSGYSDEVAISRSTPTRRTNAADAVPGREPVQESEVRGRDIAVRVTPRGVLLTRHTTRTDPTTGRDSRAGHRTRPRTAPRTGAVPGGGAPRPPGPYRGQSRTRPGGSDTVFQADLE